MCEAHGVYCERTRMRFDKHIEPNRDVTLLIAEIERLRLRVENLRGLCKSASGWLLDAGDTAHADDLLRYVGDMER